ncbi:MAG: YdeI/OmpD-associated family protein [Patescibacteria group bacterium]
MEKTLPELEKALAKNAKAKAAWKDLTPIGRRDFTTWIQSAKLPETRKRRMERTPSMLLSGKRRPCCYAIVPSNLYKALDSLPKAKATWKTLTPDQKRDFVDWIDSATSPEARMKRIEKTCVLLSQGKRRPA